MLLDTTPNTFNTKPHTLKTALDNPLETAEKVMKAVPDTDNIVLKPLSFTVKAFSGTVTLVGLGVLSLVKR